MILQLPTPIPLDTPKGPAFAHMVIDYGQEHYVLFVCFLNDSGECWTFPNRDVRLRPNLTMDVRTRQTTVPQPSATPDVLAHFPSRVNGNGAHTQQPVVG